MQEQTYNWKRFWYGSDQSIQTLPGGFLHDPEGQYGHVFSPYAVPFSAIADIPGLGLIAEPGMGKSRTLEMEQAAIDAALTTQGARSLWLNLREYGDESRLIRNLFESGEFREWLAGDYRLHLFLDSLDEALLQINVLAPMLLGELRKYPVARLSLRIACRAADWPTLLEAGLRKLWGSESVHVYRLAPLRYADVIEAANVNAVDPDAFLREKGLFPEVLTLSLHPAERLSLRIRAVMAIQAIGDEDTKAQLKPLLYTEAEHDTSF